MSKRNKKNLFKRKLILIGGAAAIIVIAAVVFFTRPKEVVLERAGEVYNLFSDARGVVGCQGKEGCDKYCRKPGNLKQCVEFAEQYRTISPDDAQIILGAGSIYKEDVDRYCASSDMMRQKCQMMFVAHGIMTQDQATIENLGVQFARENCGVTNGDRAKIEECLWAICSRDDNAEKCWKYQISIGSKTQADYAAWLATKEVIEREAGNAEKGINTIGN